MKQPLLKLDVGGGSIEVVFPVLLKVVFRRFKFEFNLSQALKL